ncbi:MAG: hypothetical protein C4555_03750 [Dehalococcoidia bacterium]|nr:MAG: hypothetical protein C4555_03750 [Dehalococcoidia bacterium]
MADKMTKKKMADGTEVPVLAETFDQGKPEAKDLGWWRQKLSTREEKLRYLKTAERYWYSTDWYGSEKRKNPA